MTDTKYLSLYTGNHGKLDGIEDYITLIAAIMGKRGIDVKVSSTLDPEAINVIIDEFTNYVENRRIANFKTAYPHSRMIFVLTEFTVRNWGVTSFNNFGGPLDAATIALFDVYLRLARDDFGKIGFGSVLRLLCYSPLLAIQLLPAIAQLILRIFFKRFSRQRVEFLRSNHRTIYFHMRYLGLMASLHHADAVITSHEKVFEGTNRESRRPLEHFGVLYAELDPETVIDKLMREKKLFMEITGTVTRYRQKWIERINRQLTTLGLQNVFYYCKALPFSFLASDEPANRAAYSLHPPQTRTWPYSSPTRLFRALSVDHNLPVLTHHFHQNPIEDVCFEFKGTASFVELYEMFNDRSRLRNFVEPKLKRYNEIVTARNDMLAQHVRKLLISAGRAS
ncbi:hypothetical protein LPJ38_30100 [Bradyrhizobium daqingense]|uniref:Glycosyl transferase family 1 n=1 Tax=Bradyrhizobium daqingense TaxID=993502 RepID=A0A562KUE1_9BRAD|nr:MULTISPECIES: hypothetical protein [Bradyrhizobium]MDQ8731317.1 hypothetical protein [Bradyrhizobium sp. LHD-71]TWH98813.1 hypothetical protein IQ17_05670 [Bradyrhizobium daqingense]UFS87846.1 hypothetical protein LPJ38_30100 [Bradyrhizobium daqingense]